MRRVSKQNAMSYAFLIHALIHGGISYLSDRRVLRLRRGAIFTTCMILSSLDKITKKTVRSSISREKA